MSAKDKQDSKVLVSNQKDVKEGREEIIKVHTRTVIAQTKVRQRWRDIARKEKKPTLLTAFEVLGKGRKVL
jgi:hypothetical protein